MTAGCPIVVEALRLSGNHIRGFRAFTVTAGILSSAVIMAFPNHVHADVVAQLSEAIKAFNRIDLKASVHIEVLKGISDGDLPASEDSILTIKRLDDRALVSRKSKYTRRGSEPIFTQNDLVLYDNGDVLNCQADLDQSLRQRDGITDNLMFMLYSKRIAAVQKIDATSMYNYLNDSGVALWIIGYAPLHAYLDLGNLDVKTADNGAEITSRSKNGVLSLTLSKKYGWLPVSFRLVKAPGDSTVGGLVGDVYGNGIKDVTWTGDLADFKSDGAGHWFPQRMNVSRTTSFFSGRTGVTTTAITLEKLEYNPHLTESDFRTSIVAPVGFPVTVAGATHLPYQWDGKMVIPGAPELPTRSPIVNGSSGPAIRWGLIALNAILVVVVMILLWKKWGAATS